MNIGREALQHSRLIAHLHVERIDQRDGEVLARIVGAPKDRAGDQLLRRDAQARNRGLGNGLGPMIQRQDLEEGALARVHRRGF